MRTNEVLDLMNEIEHAAPVDRWQMSGVRVWPIVRSLLWRHLDDSCITRTVPRPAGHRAAALLGFGAWAKASLVDRRGHAPGRGHVDVVALGDNVSRVRLAGSWYDRVCEPVLEGFEANGCRSLLLEPYHIYRTPRHRSGQWVQPRIDARRMVTRLISRARDDRMPDLVGYDLFTDLLASRGAHLDVFAPVAIAREADAVIAAAATFERLLQRRCPRLGLVVDYAAVSMAFNLACRRSGIPSIELPHGVQGPLHWAYSRWENVPDDGYELLPTWYWTWTEADAETLEAWNGARSDFRAVAAGNPWLAQWQDPSNPVVARYDAEVAATLARGALTVLVTLQGGVHDEVMQRLLSLPAQSPEGIRWWFRFHPTMAPSERVSLRGALADAPAVELDGPSSLPLPALLRAVDVHLTYHSSTVIEAETFGVASVALSEDVAAMFPELVSAGWVAYVGASDDVLGALRQQSEARQRLTRVSSPPRPVRDVAEELVAAIGARGGLDRSA
jgi:hypothetical protein